MSQPTNTPPPSDPEVEEVEDVEEEDVDAEPVDEEARQALLDNPEFQADLKAFLEDFEKTELDPYIEEYEKELGDHIDEYDESMAEADREGKVDPADTAEDEKEKNEPAD